MPSDTRPPIFSKEWKHRFKTLWDKRFTLDEYEKIELLGMVYERLKRCSILRTSKLSQDDQEDIIQKTILFLYEKAMFNLDTKGNYDKYGSQTGIFCSLLDNKLKDFLKHENKKAFSLEGGMGFQEKYRSSESLEPDENIIKDESKNVLSKTSESICETLGLIFQRCFGGSNNHWKYVLLRHYLCCGKSKAPTLSSLSKKYGTNGLHQKVSELGLRLKGTYTLGATSVDEYLDETILGGWMKECGIRTVDQDHLNAFWSLVCSEIVKFKPTV